MNNNGGELTGGDLRQKFSSCLSVSCIPAWKTVKMRNEAKIQGLTQRNQEEFAKLSENEVSVFRQAHLLRFLSDVEGYRCFISSRSKHLSYIQHRRRFCRHKLQYKTACSRDTHQLATDLIYSFQEQQAFWIMKRRQRVYYQSVRCPQFKARNILLIDKSCQTPLENIWDIDVLLVELSRNIQNHEQFCKQFKIQSNLNSAPIMLTFTDPEFSNNTKYVIENPNNEDTINTTVSGNIVYAIANVLHYTYNLLNFDLDTRFILLSLVICMFFVNLFPLCYSNATLSSEFVSSQRPINFMEFASGLFAYAKNGTMIRLK